MNEQIKQLAEQCGFRSNPNIYDRNQSFDIQKFAELIVRECAGRVDNILREKKDGGGTMGDEIREHFGVQE